MLRRPGVVPPCPLVTTLYLTRPFRTSGSREHILNLCKLLFHCFFAVSLKTDKNVCLPDALVKCCDRSDLLMVPLIRVI